MTFGSLEGRADRHGVVSDRLVLGIEETRTEICGSSAIDDRNAYDVRPLVEVEARRDTVVDYGLAIPVDVDDFLPVDPPDRGGVGADGQADVVHLLWRIHGCHRPEENIRGWLTEGVSEVKKVDVVIFRFDSVPGKFGACERDPVSVVWDNGELIGEILLCDLCLNSGLCEAGGGDGFKDDPALDEAVRIGRSFGG